MKQFFRKYWKIIIFTISGAVSGFAYWRFVGCNSGSCPITSTWHTSILMGGLLGFLVSGPGKKEENDKS